MDQYAKNKIKTENYLKKKLKKNLISLRISNVLGKRQLYKIEEWLIIFFR